MILDWLALSTLLDPLQARSAHEAHESFYHPLGFIFLIIKVREREGGGEPQDGTLMCEHAPYSSIMKAIYCYVIMHVLSFYMFHTRIGFKDPN